MPSSRAACGSVFGPLADRVPGSSTKSMIGHPQGASGAAGIVTAAMALRDGFLPPTINQDTPRSRMRPRLHPQRRPRRRRLPAALCNCLGFGSKNSADRARAELMRERPVELTRTRRRRRRPRRVRLRHSCSRAPACSVRVFDRARFPRFKLCGDSVNPGALAILARLDLAAVVEGALPVDGMIVTSAAGRSLSGSVRRRPAGLHRSRGTVSTTRSLPRRVRLGRAWTKACWCAQPTLDSGRVSGVEVGDRRGRQVHARAHRDCGRRRELTSRPCARPGPTCARSRGAGRSARTSRAWRRAATAPDGFGEMHLRTGRYIGIAPLPGGVDKRLRRDCRPRRAARSEAAAPRHVAHDPGLADRFADARAVTRPVCLGPLAVEATDERCARACCSPATPPASSIR